VLQGGRHSGVPGLLVVRVLGLVDPGCVLLSLTTKTEDCGLEKKKSLEKKPKQRIVILFMERLMESFYTMVYKGFRYTEEYHMNTVQREN
jgi:hypothetical protein